MREAQHINVKLFASGEPDIHWDALIPVFHRWIQNRTIPGGLIDVANYSHVPAGPGVMLIGHHAFYSVDNREGRPGLLYNRRTTLDGTTEEKLAEAYEGAVRAASQLEQEPEFAGKIRFDRHACEVTINDRLIAPNTEETWSELAPDFERFFAARFGGPVSFTRNSDPRELLRVKIAPAAQ